MMNKRYSGITKLLSMLLALIMLTSLLPTQAVAAGVNSLVESMNNESSLENNAIHVDVSKTSGAFYIRTVAGDKLVKGDEYANLLWPSEDDTSFTTVRITRGGVTKDYIFGKDYGDGSTVAVTNDGTQIQAVWTVDSVTFTQTIALQPSNNDAHGMVVISYSAKNNGETADIGIRVLLDTAMGGKDYACYSLGNGTIVEAERELDVNGYNKSIYMMDDPSDPLVTGYILNGSVDGSEKKPVKTIFAHWANLASTVYDYTPDTSLFFTNAYNARHLTSDSAAALYYSLGTVVPNATASTQLNYGLYSNEKVNGYQVAVNLQTVDALSYTDETESAFVDNGIFTAKTILQNASRKTYGKVRIYAFASGGIQVLNSDKSAVSGNGKTYGYENPYYVEINDFTPGQKVNNLSEWNFQATMAAEANYGRIHFKAYDMSDSDIPLESNLIGEAKKYILIPGSTEKLPNIQLTGSAPNVFHTEGHRIFNVTGMRFAGLESEADRYSLKLTRKDGGVIRGNNTSIILPSASFAIEQDGTGLMTVTIDGNLPAGEYKVTVDYTDTAREDIDAKALEFQVVDDTRYRCETYGLVVVYGTETNNDNGDHPRQDYLVETFADEEGYSQWRSKNPGVKEKDVLMIFKGVFDDLTDSLPEDAEKSLGADEHYAVYLTAKIPEDGTNNVVMSNAMQFSYCEPGSNVTIKQICKDIKNPGGDQDTEKNSVKVDLDCSVTTAGVGTRIFSGVCCFTELKADTRYRLVDYDEAGERDDTVGNTIALIWPGAGVVAQYLMGAMFNFQYGELGIMDTGKGLVRTVGFGGGLDLSCIIPKKQDEYWHEYEWSSSDSIKMTPDEQRAWNEANDIRRQSRSFSEKNKDRANTAVANGFYDDDDSINISGSVQVSDILFGANSFIGFNFCVGVGIPPLAYGMPSLEGVFTLRTIGQVDFRVNGQLNFTTVELEALLDLKSNDKGILIPDEFKFFVGGFTPGIPLDPFGVLWLQGGGGGIKDIYETIYLQDNVPPIKLILQAQFSVMQVMVAKATVELGLTGFGIAMSDVKIMPVDIVVLNSAVVALRWYPNLAFIGSVQVDLLDMIEGGGYMVGYINYDGSNPFFEFFLRAALHLPGSIPIVGGMTLGAVNMGVSTERIFGCAEALFIKIGFSYYWRNEFDWGIKNEASPTFPELLGLGQEFDTDIDEMFEGIPTGKDDDDDDEDGGKGTNSTNSTKNLRGMPLNTEQGVPVYYDKANNRTLMAVPGTNFVKNNTVILRGENDGGEEQTSSTQNTLKISPDGRKVDMTFGANGKDKIILLTWDSDSEEAAAAQAASLNTGDYAITLLDHNTDAAEQTNANANLTYDGDAKKASLAITVTDSRVKGMNITGSFAMDAVLYDVNAVPELEENKCSATLTSSQQLRVNIQGTGLNTFDYVNVGLVNVNDLNKEESPAITMVGRIEKENGVLPASATMQLPPDLPSGRYEVRMMASDDALTQISQVELAPIDYVNPNTPSNPVSVGNITGAGDWKVNIPVNVGSADDFDGYAVTVTDSEGKEVSGLTDMMFYKNGTPARFSDDGTLTVPEDNTDAGLLTIGGHMEVPVSDTSGEDGTMTANDETMTKTEIVGFKAGSYTVSIKKWKSADGIPVYSEAVNKAFAVTEPAPATVAITGGSTVSRTELRGDETVTVPYYTDEQLQFTLTSDKAVTGSWVVDDMNDVDGFHGEVESAATATITLSNLGLADGVHTITFTGETSSGDTSAACYSFGVDNSAPAILVSSPENGGTFDGNGSITFTGVTDPDTTISFYDQTIGRSLTPTVAETDSETGEFTATVSLTSNVATHQLVLIAVDDLGNRNEKSFSLRNGLLTSVKKLHLYEGSTDMTEKTLTAGSHTMRIVGTTEAGQVVEFNDPSMVEWDAQTLEGTALIGTLSQDGTQFVITASDDTVGVITAKLLVSDTGAYPVSCMVGSRLSANPKEITVEVGGTSSISVSAETDTALTFTSGDETVATVQADSDGMATVTGIKAGTTTVTVTASNGETATVTVNVVDEIKYTVTIDADTGSVVTVAADFTDENGGVAIHNGDTVDPDTVLTVTATAKPGFELSSDPTGTYTVTDDLTITARSVPKTYTVTATATTGGAAPAQNPANPVPYGTTVTLTAGAASEGYEFIGWYQPNGKLLTSETVYSVTVTSNVTYEARYRQTTGVVTFMSNNNVVATYSEDITAYPADPTPYYGYEFDRWDMTIEEINTARQNGNVTVTAKFKAETKTFTVTVYNGEKAEPTVTNYSESTIVKLKANTVSGKTFAYWMMDGEILSYNSSTSFRANASCTVTAVYAAEAIEAVGTATLRTSTYDASTKKLVTNVYLTVPDGAKIVKAGLLAASPTISGTKYTDTNAELTSDNADYVKSSTAAVGKSAPVSYTWTKSSVNPQDVWYLRAYITYTLNNETRTVYGDRVTVRAGEDYNSSEKGTATIKTKTYNPDTKKAQFNAYLTVPKGGVIAKAGLVASSTINPTAEVLTAENAQYVKSSTLAVGKGAPVSYTWTKSSVSPGDTWYVRAYLVYTLDGTEHTVYGKLETLNAPTV